METRLSPIDPVLNRLSEAVIGAAIAVHRALGAGYLESVYQEALALEFSARQIPCIPQYRVGIVYRDTIVGEGILDFLVDQKLVVELKAVDSILPIHRAQVISYLKATRCNLGLLINFNEETLTKGIRRVIYT